MLLIGLYLTAGVAWVLFNSYSQTAQRLEEHAKHCRLTRVAMWAGAGIGILLWPLFALALVVIFGTRSLGER